MLYSSSQINDKQRERIVSDVGYKYLDKCCQGVRVYGTIVYHGTCIAPEFLYKVRGT